MFLINFKVHKSLFMVKTRINTIYWVRCILTGDSKNLLLLMTSCFLLVHHQDCVGVLNFEFVLDCVADFFHTVFHLFSVNIHLNVLVYTIDWDAFIREILFDHVFFFIVCVDFIIEAFAPGPHATVVKHEANVLLFVVILLFWRTSTNPYFL